MENVNRNTPLRTASQHPLLWVAAIAVIVLSMVGIAAFMGWIPDSTAHPEDRNAAAHRTGAGMAASKPAAPTKPISVATAPAKCLDCGEIASIREITTKAKGSGLGAAGGAVVGGLLGHQVGEGQGKDVATIAGVVGGAVAGNEIEKRTRATKSYEITVRLDDGSTQIISASSPPAWKTGDRVKVVNGVIQSSS